jgi:hypothetical protein
VFIFALNLLPMTVLDIVLPILIFFLSAVLIYGMYDQPSSFREPRVEDLLELLFVESRGCLECGLIPDYLSIGEGASVWWRVRFVSHDLKITISPPYKTPIEALQKALKEHSITYHKFYVTKD